MATKKEKVAQLVEDGRVRAEEKKQEMADAKVKPIKAKDPVERAEESPIASAYAKQLEAFASMTNGIAKRVKEKVFTLVQLENKARSLNLATQAAEKNLARLEGEAQRAIAMGSAGVRQIAAQVAKERDENDNLRARLELQEKTLAREVLANQEIKAMYETKLSELSKFGAAIPGD